MKEVKFYVAILCALLLVAPAGFAQQTDRTPQIGNEGGPWHDRFTRNYNPAYVPPISVSNSSRLDQLIRAGNLYLSLNDAIALALENNIDIEVQRYQFDINEWALRGAEAGQNGAFDPRFQSTWGWGQRRTISTNAFTAGGQSVNLNNTRQKDFSISQGFATGANFSLGFTNSSRTTNNANDFFSPNLSTTLSLQGSQPLLQGFGLALNRRGITIAQNNLRLSDHQFQQQVNTTLNTVIQAYWNLVSASLSVDVAQQSLDLAETLYQNNQKQVEIGTLAPIEVVNAEAQVENNRTALVNAQTQVLQRETNLKNLISRNGIASPVIADVRIIPTDRVQVPDVEPVQPIQDLMASALATRPELAQQQISMDNTRINLKATRNSMLPQVNLTGNISNPGSGGPINPAPNYDPVSGNVLPRDTSRINPNLIGGYTNILTQVFGAPTVSWNFGVQVNIPLRNRTAKAQMAQQEFQLRQTELQYQRQVNQIRVDVQNALIAVQQARAQYQAAVKTTALQEQVLEAEQKKYGLGASTVYQVIQYQRDLANARQQEVNAQVTYAFAKLQMDVATGTLLDKYNISFQEAKDGNIDRRPDPIPDVIDNNGQAANHGQPLSPLQRAIAGATFGQE